MLWHFRSLHDATEPRLERPAVSAKVALLLCCFLTAACAHSSSAPAAPTARDASAKVNAALSDARERAARARALEPPRYSGNGAKGDTLAFMNGPLMSWIKQRSALQAHALDAYRLNLDPRQPAVAAQAAFEAAELELDFAARFVAAARTATPRAIRADAQQTAAFQAALEDATTPQIKRARRLLRQCLDSAQAAGLAALRQRCRARLATLPAPADAGASAR